MRIRSVVCSFLVFASIMAASSSQAASSADPADFVGDMIGEAMASYRNASLSDPDREQRIIALLKQDFDLSQISRYVLGRYWVSANEQDRQNFNTLFPQWLSRPTQSA